MEPVLTVYIDEAGDPGVRDGLRYSAGRHEWLCLAAVAIRSTREDEVVGWVREMRRAAHSTQAGALHYHRITVSRRAAVCEVLATKPCRAFVLASHKSNMREYVNSRIGSMLTGGTFYNWCLRLLIERVTEWVERWSLANDQPLVPIRIVFAQRGHNYAHFFAYMDLLKMQKQEGTLFLKGPGLAPALLDRSQWLVEPAHAIAGLQLADTVGSAFYQAANSASPSWDTHPAETLKPIIAHKAGSAHNHGVTVFPLPHQATLPELARPIFRKYGYEF
jgi:hypothetical protein